MTTEELKSRNFECEITFSSSKSGGPGGQNVNKVNTKVELRINLLKTILLSESEKETVFKKLKNKINAEGALIITAQSERSQLLNKKVVTEKFYDLLSKALTIPVKRKSTMPTYSSRVKRLEEKKSRANIKKLRKNSGESSE